MKVLNFFIVLSLIIAMPLVIAAGGGGGGGSSGGGSSGGVTSYSDIKCTDAGVISFTRKPAWNDVVVEHVATGKILSVDGEWDSVSFTSDEVLLTEKGAYIVIDPKHGNKTVECPGFKFACSIVKLSLNECFLGNDLTAIFTLENAEVEDLKFEFKQPGTAITLKHQRESKSSQLKSLEVTNLGKNYQLEVRNAPPVTELQVSIPQCVGKNYVYSKIDCIQPQQPIGIPEEKSGKKLKCGGYIGIEDRVRCRLDLRGDERDEFENFFPEECLTHIDEKACLELYQKVAGCWDNVRCHMRTNCLKEAIAYNPARQCSNKECRKDQNEKILTYIKLQFYNLEEQAEMLEERGVLEEDQLVDFIVFAELKKQEFNQAKNKGQMLKIINQVRLEWKKLMLKVDK
jgi:hypothetical protein